MTCGGWGRGKGEGDNGEGKGEGDGGQVSGSAITSFFIFNSEQNDDTIQSIYPENPLRICLSLDLRRKKGKKKYPGFVIGPMVGLTLPKTLIKARNKGHHYLPRV